ncbi:hypothetical protein ACS0TY_007965 [Phlomoides rotata]
MRQRFLAISTRQHTRKSSNYNLSRAQKLQSNCQQQHYSSTLTANFNPDAALQQPSSLQNPFVLNKIVSWCAETGCCSVGVQLHSHAIKLGFHENVCINTSLVDMYGKCGQISWAHKVFDGMPDRNAVTWNALISCYVKARDPSIAIELFIEMLREDIPVTPFGVSSALVACAQLGDNDLGVQVQGLSLKEGLEFNVVVGSNLIDIYAKFGNMEDSRKVFDGLVDKNVVVWTSMIAGYAHNHFPDKSMILLKEMFLSGLKANYITYNTLLSSFRFPDDLCHCRQIHCRVIQEGLDSNPFLVTTFLIAYSEKHYACVVDLYGRAGFLDEAEAFINSMCIEKGPCVYKALLSACQVYGNKEIAVRCGRRLMELCPDDPALYVLLANVLATDGSWDDAAVVRKLMRVKGVTKKAGCSRV